MDPRPPSRVKDPDALKRFRLEHLDEPCACGNEKDKRARRCAACYHASRNTPQQKPCPNCGVEFVPYDNRLVYCSKQCSDDNLSVIRIGEGNPNWSPAPIHLDAGRQRARRRFPSGPCQQCGAVPGERHHIDGNPFNNTPSNISVLCRRCHMVEDGRMDALLKLNASRSKAS